MASTHTHLLYHLIFATKGREPVIDAGSRERLYEYLGGLVRGMDGIPQGVGGVADHVHLLVSLKPIHSVSDFMRELKRHSSRWVGEQLKSRHFKWQEGYAAFTVSESSREKVRDYIARQEEHHRMRSFREELVGFLERCGVDYDERYLD